MVRALMRVFAFVSLVPLFVGCATTSGAQAPGPTPIVATYGDKVIRLGEVDAKGEEELTKLQEQIYDLRVETAERIALEALVAEAAKAAGKSEDEWLTEQVDRDLPEPGENELRRLYDQVQARLPEGVGFDEVKPQLVQALQREARKQKAAELFEALKTKANFKVTLEAPRRARVVVDATGPTRGEAQAPITIVEFADFQCPFCSRAAATVEKVLAAYPGKVKLVFRHFPLSFHEKAPKAAEAGACADEQGRFWAMHDALFAGGDLDPDGLKLAAKSIGLDSAKFDECLDSGRMAAVVKRDMVAGQKVGVTGTPAFFINGRPLSGARPEEEFRKVIDQELAAP